MELKKLLSDFKIGFKDGFYFFSELTTGLVNVGLLFLAYVFVIIPTKLVAAIVGKSFLERSKEWSEVDSCDDEDSFYRQF